MNDQRDGIHIIALAEPLGIRSATGHAPFLRMPGNSSYAVSWGGGVNCNYDKVKHRPQLLSAMLNLVDDYNYLIINS